MSSSSPTVHVTLGRGVLLGLTSGLLLAALEGAALLVRASASFDEPSEAWRCVLDLLGLLGSVGVLAGAVGAVLALGVGAAARRGAADEVRASRWAAWLWTALAAPGVAWTVAQAFHGRRMQLLPARSLLLAAAVAVGVLLVHAAVRLVAWLLRRAAARTAVGAGLAALALLGAATVQAVNLRVLPRLYLFFHLGLAVLTAALLAFAVAAVSARRRRSVATAAASWTRAMVLVALAGLGAGAWSLRQLARDPISRAVVFDETQASARVLAAASALRLQPRALGGARALPARPRPTLPPLPAGPRFDDADLVLITVDALRGDRLAPDTMPRLSTLADAGVRFEHAYSQVPHTSFSLTTLLTGKYAYSLAAIGAKVTADETLASLLRRERYKTAGFFPPAVFYIDHDRFVALEQSAFDFEYVKYEYMDAPGRTDQVIRFFEEERPPRAFVWVHYFEPHEPYELHPEARAPGAPEPTTARGRYDEEVRFVDGEVARLVDWLGAHRKRAIVAFSADHGEEFGEHGGRYHGTTLYEEQVRVPLFFAEVGTDTMKKTTGQDAVGLPARTLTAPVAVIDVAPTLLGLAGVMPSAQMRGQDLGPWLSRQGASEERLPPVFAEVNTMKLIASESARLICDVSHEVCELYDLVSDPGEKKNLAGREPERVASLQARLEQWMSGQSRFEREAQPGLAEQDRLALERVRLGDRQAVPRAAWLLGSTDAKLRDTTARALLGVPDDPAVHEAIFAAHRAHPENLLLSSLALRAGDRSLLEPLLEVAQREVSAPEPTLPPLVLAELGLTLLHDGQPGAVAVLGGVLGRLDGNEEMERRVLRALGATHDRAALAPLLANLPRIRTRLNVVRALGELGDRDAVPRLLDEVEDEHYVDVRAAMVKALGQLGDRRAVPTLLRLAKREPEATVMDEVVTALAQLGALRRAGGFDARALARRAGWRCDKQGCLPTTAGAWLPSGRTLWLVAMQGARGVLDAGGATVDLSSGRGVYAVPERAEDATKERLRVVSGAPVIAAVFAR